jgi:hypothetical protein
MTESTPASNLGRHIFGVAALAFGLITLAWHDYNGWHQPRYLIDAAGAAQILGGTAIQFRRTAKTGAVLLGAVYVAFALLCVPGIVAAPRIYNSWGNFFEQFSLVTGPEIVYVRLSSTWSRETPNRMGRILFGICAASFTLEQAFYLHATASLVPKWLPPGQMFWAVTTTVLFALAAVALLANQMALLAPAHTDARHLWATRVGTVASFRSPQSYELERNRRNLRNCRSSMDPRRSPGRVSAQ